MIIKKKWLIFSILLNMLLIILLLVLGIKDVTISEFNFKLESIIFQRNTLPESSYYREKVDQFRMLNNEEKRGIIFLGDSITDMGDWNRFFPNENITNMGINGDTVQGVMDRLYTVYKLQPRKIFIMIGTNDLSGRETPSALANRYESMVDKLIERLPNTKIYIQSILPVNNIFWKKSLEEALRTRKENNQDIIKSNKLIKQIAKEKNVYYINLYPFFVNQKNGQLDMKYSSSGLHLNGNGYKVWLHIVKKYVEN